ncbi:hypothetical protein [Persicobacter psychrovividus]|uniref:Uncharacterized protein n=1 Tax=Persicobacter psychrovividus TaxID=387638 RepID=A0ABN6L6Z0_9BACT|nr:hypothetical protein PEPS_12350 [Persicobacter psychrovividus]
MKIVIMLVCFICCATSGICQTGLPKQNEHAPKAPQVEILFSSPNIPEGNQQNSISIETSILQIGDKNYIDFSAEEMTGNFELIQNGNNNKLELAVKGANQTVTITQQGDGNYLKMEEVNPEKIGNSFDYSVSQTHGGHVIITNK